MTLQASRSLRNTLASVSNCSGAERIDAEISGSDPPRLSEDAGDVRSSTWALASYWLGASWQYNRHSSSSPPTIDANKRRLRTNTRQSSPRDMDELCRLTPVTG